MWCLMSAAVQLLKSVRLECNLWPLLQLAEFTTTQYKDLWKVTSPPLPL